MRWLTFVIASVCLLILKIGVSEEESLAPCTDGLGDTRCCLCSGNNICLSACPEGFQNFSSSNTSCSNTTMVGGNSTQGTTQDPRETTVALGLSTSATGSPGNELDTICVKCDTHEFLNVSSTICEPCSPVCISCKGPSEDECTCKYEFEGSCVQTCPTNTTKGNVTVGKHGNTTQCEPKPKAENESDENESNAQQRLIYIVAGVGGGALLIIVVVVVVVCVVRCRRNSSNDLERRSGNSKSRTAMSEIIVNRDSDGKPQRPPVSAQKMGNTETQRRHNYENTENPGPDFAKKVEQQTDQVLRYTKDPTLKKNTKQQARAEQGFSIYENQNMVRLQNKMDLTHESSENIHQALEAEEVYELPQAPGAPGQRTTGPQKVVAPSKQTWSKVNILKRLSQRISRKGNSKQRAKQADTVQMDYIDMSNMEASQEEDYMNISTSAGDQTSPSNQASRQAGLTGDQSAGQDQGTPNEAELEDYENVTISKNAAEQGQEDYENPPAVVKQLQASEEQEDYENPPEVVRQLQAAEAEMEDYENIEMRKPVDEADSESLYVNYSFNKKK